MKRIATLAAALLLVFTGILGAQGLQKGDLVGVCGDSITEQKLYSMFIEDYLVMCQPQAGLRVTQFGWGGETAPGFLAKMPGEALKFDLTAATTCYGMNDGGYSPMDEAKGRRYRDAMTAIVKAFKARGVRFIVVGSPGAVDFDFFRRGQPNQAEMAQMYNKTLGALRDIAQEVARAEGAAFADVFTPMVEAQTRAKAKLGKNYHVCGPDGFHPDRNGHLVMAYAFLKGLGCDGNIGTITMDLAGNKAEATDGHKVLSCAGGQVEIESSRYPFCFYGDPKSTGATSGIIEFFPFNQELNRYMLVVKGASGKVKVTWGEASKEFAADDAAKGINLAAEFINNPFSGPFAEMEKAIAAKQQFETPLVKSLLHGLADMKKVVPDEAENIERIGAKAIKKDYEMQAAITASVKPVRHSIKVEAAK